MSEHSSLSRREIMSGVAALPAAAVLPAVSAAATIGPDPIFAAIEQNTGNWMLNGSRYVSRRMTWRKRV